MTHRQHGRTTIPTTLDGLANHVSQTHIDGAKATSKAFRDTGVAHVLVPTLKKLIKQAFSEE